MEKTPVLPWFFRLIRPSGLVGGLFLSPLALVDLAVTARLAAREPLAILPDAEIWTAEMLQASLYGLGLGPEFFSFFSLSFRRIQEWVDRWLYREKYNADAALAGFSRNARAEADLDRLVTALIMTANDTMRPAKTSLCLKSDRSGS